MKILAEQKLIVIYVFDWRNYRRIMKRADHSQIFRVKLAARAAIETSAIRIVPDCKRTADVFVPAAEKRSNKTDFTAENFAVSVDNRFRYRVLFQNSLHFITSP